MTWCSIGQSSHVQRQVGLIEIPILGCQRCTRAAGQLLHLLESGLKSCDATQALCAVPDPGSHQPIQVTLADPAFGGDVGDPHASVRARNLEERFGNDVVHVHVHQSIDEKPLEHFDVLLRCARGAWLEGESAVGMPPQPDAATYQGIGGDSGHEKGHTRTEPHANQCCR